MAVGGQISKGGGNSHKGVFLRQSVRKRARPLVDKVLAKSPVPVKEPLASHSFLATIRQVARRKSILDAPLPRSDMEKETFKYPAAAPRPRRTRSSWLARATALLVGFVYLASLYRD